MGSRLPSRCGRCNFPVETIQHILNGCESERTQYTKRHDRIVTRTARALIWTQHLSEQEALRAYDALNRDMKLIGLGRGATLYLNKTPPHCTGSLRPDITLLNRETNRAIVIDVQIPFEMDSGLFAVSRAEKVFKYRGIAAELNTVGFRVVLGAIVVGSRGAWDPVNENLLKECGCPDYYIREMARWCVTEVIGFSRDIYNQHIHGTAAAGPRLQPSIAGGEDALVRALGGMLILPAVARPTQQSRVPLASRQPGMSSQRGQTTNGSSGATGTTTRRRASMSGADLRVTVRGEEEPQNKRARYGAVDHPADESQEEFFF